jgi:hypothetical protein
MRTVFELMQATACKLARKVVCLRLNHNEGYKGLCRTDSSGRVTIDMEPELQFQNKKEFLRVFLHEISHAKNHKFTPLDFEVSDKMEVVEDKVYNLREEQADTEASTWLKYAEENREIIQPYFEGCLWSLFNSTF